MNNPIVPEKLQKRDTTGAEATSAKTPQPAPLQLKINKKRENKDFEVGDRADQKPLSRKQRQKLKRKRRRQAEAGVKPLPRLVQGKNGKIVWLSLRGTKIYHQLDHSKCKAKVDQQAITCYYKDPDICPFFQDEEGAFYADPTKLTKAGIQAYLGGAA